MFIQYFKKVVVNALLISFEMDLRTPGSTVLRVVCDSHALARQ
jgi:hypothetical protein